MRNLPAAVGVMVGLSLMLGTQAYSQGDGSKPSGGGGETEGSINLTSYLCLEQY